MAKEANGLNIYIEFEGNEWTIRVVTNGGGYRTLFSTSCGHGDTKELTDSLKFLNGKVLSHVAKQEELMTVVTPEDDAFKAEETLGD